jgi:carboxyl-terminal processing protease
MNIRKLSILLSVFAGLLAAFSAALGQPISKETKAALLEAISERITKTAYVQGADFSKWPDMMAKHQAQFDKAKTAESFAAAVNLAFDDFHFSHLQLLTPRAAGTQFTGKSVGIGILAQPTSDGIRIAKIIKGGPAEKAGLKVGDLIVKGDGKPVTQPEQIRGDADTQVALTIKRDDKTFDVTITRKPFSVLEPDTLTWPEPKTALITIHTFGVGYDPKLIDKMFADAAKAENLIIDIRGNGGGRVDNLQHLAGKVLSGSDSMGKFITRTDAARFQKKYPDKTPDPVAVSKEYGFEIDPLTPKEGWYKGKLEVLISPGSGSASEIFASTIQDHKRGKIIGTRSAGAVLASAFFALPEDYRLQVPFMEYVSFGGRRLEGEGVKPDVPLDLQTTADDEKVLKAALLAFSDAKLGG